MLTLLLWENGGVILIYNPHQKGKLDASQERAAPELMKSSQSETEEQNHLGCLITADGSMENELKGRGFIRIVP